MERNRESEKIMMFYPDRIPIIVEKVPNSEIPEMDKSKFLITRDVTGIGFTLNLKGIVAQFMYIIRKRIQLDPEMAIFIFVDKLMPSAS